MLLAYENWSYFFKFLKTGLLDLYLFWNVPLLIDSITLDYHFKHLITA